MNRIPFVALALVALSGCGAPVDDFTAERSAVSDASGEVDSLPPASDALPGSDAAPLEVALETSPVDSPSETLPPDSGGSETSAEGGADTFEEVASDAGSETPSALAGEQAKCEAHAPRLSWTGRVLFGAPTACVDSVTKQICMWRLGTDKIVRCLPESTPIFYRTSTSPSCSPVNLGYVYDSYPLHSFPVDATHYEVRGSSPTSKPAAYEWKDGKCTLQSKAWPYSGAYFTGSALDLTAYVAE